MYPRKVPREEAFFRVNGIQIVTGIRYLGGFVGGKVEQDCWLGDTVEDWRYSVATLAGVVHRHQKTAYKGLQKFLHQDWSFMQRVTPDIGMFFKLV